MVGRPRDECPYRKPFPPGFRACAAYQPAQFVPLDMRYRVLTPVWTCSHLDVRTFPASPHRHYARCRLGDAQARTDHVEELREDRITILRAMQEDLAAALGKLGSEMWAAKGRQLQAAPGSTDQAAAAADMRRLGLQVMVSVEAFLARRRRDLDRLGLPIDACRGLFEDLLEDWVEQPNAQTPEISDRALARFPAEVRVLLRPAVRSPLG
jgi:hypothetical protein